MNNDTSCDPSELSRRDFGSAAAAAAIMASLPANAAVPVTEADVTIVTPDGTCDAVIAHPTSGKHPAVLVWTDILGLRPVFRDMGKRLAAEGYAVLTPNPFYRVAKAPVLPADANFGDPATRAKLMPMMGSIVAPGACEKDAAACIAFLEKHASVNTSARMGTTGYCMGGPLTMRTAGNFARVGGAGSFHGGGLATDKPDSPHLLIPKMKVSYLVAIAKNDDAKEPQVKDTLKAAFASASQKAEVEVYGGDHGWTVPGSAVYDQAEAERAWTRLLATFKSALV